MSRASVLLLLTLAACVGETEFELDAESELEPELGETDSPPSDAGLEQLEAARPPLTTTALEGDDLRSIHVGDFDGDGRADVLRADWNGNGRQYNTVLLSDLDEGNHWTRWPGPTAWLGGQDRELLIGDFDGDGRDDILRIDGNGDGSQYNTWFRSNGDGTWAWRSGPEVELIGPTWRSYVGDFDGDGKADILRAQTDGTDQNRIFISAGDGSWTSWQGGLSYWLGGGDREVLIADFDGDGDDDILRADGGGDGRQYNRLALSNGSGGWAVHFNSPARILKRTGRALYVGDFDGDGKADLFRADRNGDGTQFNAAMPSNGDGSWRYWDGVDLALEPDNRALHVGDFDGDGRDDLLLADWNGDGREHNRIIRSLGGGAWTIWEQPKWWLGGNKREVRVADFDGDGLADILRADWNADGTRYNRVDLAGGDGSWTHRGGPGLWLGGDQGVGLPEIPALLRSVTGYEDGEFDKPHIPPVRTSNDGRVAVYLKPRGGREFALISPERLDDHFVHQDPGVPVFSPGSPFVVNNGWFDAAPSGNGHHLTLCDGSSAFADLPGHDSKRNPTPCDGQDGALGNDCYALSTVTTVELAGDQKQVWATPITVEVANPKTADAEIVAITPGAPVAGPIWAVKEAFEPMFTADGRLFVFRVGGSSLSWTDAEGDQRSGSYDMVYAVMPEDAEPCDVTALSDPYPIAHAPFHPGLGQRYGFARHPYRDVEGNPIPDGVEIKGTYPWIDRSGRNLFFPAIPATLHYVDAGSNQLTTRYPARCLAGVECDLGPAPISSVESGGKTRGVIAMGLWTRGKMVVLDGDFANVDYGLKQTALSHRELRLYDPLSAGAGPLSAGAGGQSGWVRLGTGRDNRQVELPDHGVANTTFIDSLENLLNYAPELVPATPRDVVWTLNSGRASADVAFDDYLHRDAIVVADMNASLTHDDPSYARNGGLMRYHDGFAETGAFAGAGFEAEVRLQNAATSTTRPIPAYGLARGRVRIEPAAVGGIVGKGLWLDGYSGVDFELPAAVDGELFASLFVDLRPDSPGFRQALRFPDGSRLLVRRDRIRYVTGGQSFTVSLDPAIELERSAWTHLALQIDASGTQVELYVDGFRRASWATPAHAPLSAGSITLGASASEAALRGWIDEFKLFVDRPDPETICNHAHGTLIGFGEELGGEWGAIAAAYPSSSHAALSSRLTAEGEASHARYACFHDYTLDHGILAEPLPAQTSALRQAVLFPEGPLVWDSPRPDSADNEFCLDCHGDDEPLVLSIAALEGRPELMQHDLRRQPMQPLRLMSGVLPAGLFGAGEPAATLSSALGELVDQWLAQ